MPLSIADLTNLTVRVTMRMEARDVTRNKVELTMVAKIWCSPTRFQRTRNPWWLLSLEKEVKFSKPSSSSDYSSRQLQWSTREKLPQVRRVLEDKWRSNNKSRLLLSSRKYLSVRSRVKKLPRERNTRAVRLVKVACQISMATRDRRRVTAWSLILCRNTGSRSAIMTKTWGTRPLRMTEWGALMRVDGANLNTLIFWKLWSNSDATGRKWPIL